VSGWAIGFIVGAVVVVVVVVLLLAMIVLARRVNAHAEAIIDALHAARDNTRGLWDLAATNAAADRVVGAAARAREGLAGREGSHE
jgi:hypothetical protein